LRWGLIKAGAKKAENKKWTDELAEELHKPVVKNLENERCKLKESMRYGLQT